MPHPVDGEEIFFRGVGILFIFHLFGIPEVAQGQTCGEMPGSVFHTGSYVEQHICVLVSEIPVFGQYAGVISGIDTYGPSAAQGYTYPGLHGVELIRNVSGDAVCRHKGHFIGVRHPSPSVIGAIFVDVSESSVEVGVPQFHV